MRTRANKILKMAGIILLMATIGFWLINNTAYTHIHMLPDGSLVTHAHPFERAGDNPAGRNGENLPGKSHHHTSLDYKILTDLQLLFLVFLALLCLIQWALKPGIIHPHQLQAVSSFVPVPPGRGPPRI